MRGTMITIGTDGGVEAVHLREPPKLEDLQKAVGGSLELVPYWSDYFHEGALHRCLVYCNEEGKIKNLPPNPKAQTLWERSFGRPLGWDIPTGATSSAAALAASAARPFRAQGRTPRP